MSNGDDASSWCLAGGGRITSTRTFHREQGTARGAVRNISATVSREDKARVATASSGAPTADE